MWLKISLYLHKIWGPKCLVLFFTVLLRAIFFPRSGIKRRYTKITVGQTLKLVEPNKLLPTNIRIIAAPKKPTITATAIFAATHRFLVYDIDNPGFCRALTRYKILRYYYGIKPRKRLTKAQLAKLGSIQMGPITFAGTMPIRQDLEVLPAPDTEQSLKPGLAASEKLMDRSAINRIHGKLGKKS